MDIISGEKGETIRIVDLLKSYQRMFADAMKDHDKVKIRALKKFTMKKVIFK